MVVMKKNPLVQQSETLAAGRGVEPLRLTITGTSRITLYAAAKPEERDDRLFPHMWVHRLRIRRSKSELSVTKDTWEALTDAFPIERTVYEWPPVDHWIGLKPPVSFERKQGLLSNCNYVLHYWTDPVLSEEQFNSEFESWKSMRYAEHHDLTVFKRNPTWVANPRSGRPMGFVYAPRADPDKARLAYIWLEVNNVVALYHFATDEFKEQVVEEYARPYQPEEQEGRKEKLRRSKFGFNVSFVGVDVKEVFEPAYMHGPPLKREEFRLTLWKQLECFRKSRVENPGAHDSETKIAVYIHSDVLETCLGGTFTLEPGDIVG
jgi:hypothetical protein